MRLAIASSVLLFGLSACGGPPPAKEPTDLKVGSTPAGPSATPPTVAAVGRGPSKEIAARWPFAKAPDVVAYGDLAGVASSELVKLTAPTLFALKEVPEPARKCGQAILATAKEMLLGSEGERSVMIVRVGGDDIKSACVPTLEGAKPITVTGATSAYRMSGSKGEVVAFQAGFVLFGTQELVETVAAGKTSGSAPNITLGADELVVLAGKDRGTSFRGALTISAERFRIAADVTLSSEKEAEQFESIFSKARGMASQAVGDEIGASDEDRRMIDRLAKAVGVSRTGAKLSLKFDLEEKPADQAKDLDAVAALAVSGVQRYLVRAKQAEAKNVLGQVAKDLVSYWESEELDAKGQVANRAKKKLFSVPATPKAIPKGTKYQSTRADWKPWDKLKFEMSSPQYYQYEIKAAKDGESADIIARGDLNGDGKPSTFVLHVVVKRPDNRIVVAPTISETNPDE